MSDAERMQAVIASVLLKKSIDDAYGVADVEYDIDVNIKSPSELAGYIEGGWVIGGETFYDHEGGEFVAIAGGERDRVLRRTTGTICHFSKMVFPVALNKKVGSRRHDSDGK